MRLSPTISLSLQQKTAPKNLMRQLVKLLPMNEAQLIDAIKSEVEENPFLSFDSTPISTGNVALSDVQIADNNTSIYHILTPQIDAHFTDHTDHTIAMEIMAYLDDDGFLRESLSPIQNAYPQTDIFQILNTLQQLSPTGVFSRNMQEFYTAYLQSEGKFSGLWKIVVENLDNISQGNTTAVIKALGYDGEKTLQHLLQGLRDFPRSPDIETAVSQIIIPDLQAKKIDGKWHVKIISQLHRMLDIDFQYVHDIRKQASRQQDKSFISQKFTSAKWLKTALKMRAETLCNVGIVLVQHQHNFLDGGDLLPLTLQQVANKTGVHISTISRIISNKYIVCPLGTIPLKSFFSNKVGDVSQQAILKILQALVDSEIHTKTVYSDDSLAIALAEKNIKVARRTIAKYRDILNIPPSHIRKRGLQNRGLLENKSGAKSYKV